MPNTHIVPATGELSPIDGKSKHRPIARTARPQGGAQLVFRFPNGYGASLIHGEGSYGYELAVARFTGPSVNDWDLDYTTPITNDVLGWLAPDEIEEALDQIAALPAASREVTA